MHPLYPNLSGYKLQRSFNSPKIIDRYWTKPTIYNVTILYKGIKLRVMHPRFKRVTKDIKFLLDEYISRTYPVKCVDYKANPKGEFYTTEGVISEVC